MASFEPIETDDFHERTGIRLRDHVPFTGSIRRIASLRTIQSAYAVLAMPRGYLGRLLAAMPLVGDKKRRPYANAKIELLQLDPRGLLVAQTFIERAKYRAIIEGAHAAFDGYCLPRTAMGLSASIVFGTDGRIMRAAAHYLPPLVERHGDKLLLLDGTHRAYLARGVGACIEAIVVSGISAPFPCAPQTWESLRIVDEKPPPEDRFVDLSPELFRDLKYVGIDG